MVDVRELGRKSGNVHRKLIVERALRTKDQDNERFYSSLRSRMQRCCFAPQRPSTFNSHASRIPRLPCCAGLKQLICPVTILHREGLLSRQNSEKVCCPTCWVNCLDWCRVGIKMSAVEVRFENLSVDADVHVGGRALPTVLNSVLNFVEVIFWSSLAEGVQDLALLCHPVLCQLCPQDQQPSCQSQKVCGGLMSCDLVQFR